MLEGLEVLLDHEVGLPAEPDGLVRDGVLVEAGRHVEVVEAGSVTLESEDVVTHAHLTVVVLLEKVTEPLTWAQQVRGAGQNRSSLVICFP